MAGPDPLQDMFDEALDIAIDAKNLPADFKLALRTFKTMSDTSNLPYTMEGFFRSLHINHDAAYVEQLKLVSISAGLSEIKANMIRSQIAQASNNGPYSLEEWERIKSGIKDSIDEYFAPIESQVDGYITGVGARVAVGEVNEFLGDVVEAAGNFFSTIKNAPPAIFESVFGAEQCFPAGTMISLADGSRKPIEYIRHGDLVLSHDQGGNLAPRTVTKLFTNTTDSFIRLSFDDERDDLLATPGHHFLTETGDYLEIGQMAQLGGGTVRVVDTDGSIVTAKAERIVYSAETASMFEEAQTQTIAFAGNAILKEEQAQGWKTYNFEVAETHTYIAGGIRVHNRSVLDFLEDHELQNLQNLRDTNGDGKYDFAVVDIDNGNVEYEVSMRTVSGDSVQVIREMTAYDKNGDLYYKRFIKDANGNVVRVVNSDLEGQQLGEDVGKSLTPIFAQSFIDADSSVFERVAGNTVIDTLLGNLGEVMGGYAHRFAVDGNSFSVFEQLDTISDGAFLDLGGDFVVAGIDSSISVINQLIVSEIFEGLELDGIDGAIFERLTSYGINEVLRGAAGNLIATDAFQDILTATGFSDASIDTINRAFAGDAFDNFTPVNVSNIIFSAVFHEIVPPIESLEGQAASVITSALVNFLEIAGQFGGPIGVVLGYVVGRVFDELFGDEPEPRAFAHIGFDKDTGHFKILDSYSADGGNEGLARDLAQKYVDGINGFVDVVKSNSNNYDEIGQWSIGHFVDQLKNAGKNGKTFDDFQALYINSYVNTVADARHDDGQMAAVRVLNKLSLPKMIDSAESIYGYALAWADSFDAENAHGIQYPEPSKSYEENIERALNWYHINTGPNPVFPTPTNGVYVPPEWHQTARLYNDFMAQNGDHTRAEFREFLKSRYGDTVYAETDVFQAIGMALTIADDYHRYLENQSEIDTQIAINPDSAFAAGWLTTLLQAREMGLANPYNLSGDSIGNNFFTADGNDSVNGNGGNDDIRTYGGNDTIRGGIGADKIRGGHDHDRLFGDDDNDIIWGGDGNDRIYGGGQYDTIHGGDGNDTVWGDYGRDVIRLQGGNDVFHDDTQNDWNGHDDVAGGLGNDTLNGNGGNDTLHGDNGEDLVNGGIGNDSIRGGGQHDTIYGGDGNDTVWGGYGRDVIRLQDGDDIFHDDSQNDSYGYDNVAGGFGNDTLNGNGGNDTLHGDDGSDLIIGGLGNDSIRGGNQNDTIRGGVGNDTVWGGNGNDRLLGDAGTDLLTGGAGADSFDFNALSDSKLGPQRDVITDFVSGTDELDLSGIDANRNLDGDQSFKYSGTNGNQANSVWYVRMGEDVFVRGDNNGDGDFDFVIELRDLAGLTAGDFIL
ncbi:hypothetical protein [Paracoccus alkanivorans]|uniref:Hint domain-containing protein n=1 Tax=Paracoccus alkanivorans TaxID=2116655 RepID=A0A3M0LWU0_9RHOB|nr:hypothetical protein [Paracoccus alkanivorans]RMC29671.1 hypothetical protein C9E81_22425 [Paracoccus alkanivorans]